MPDYENSRRSPSPDRVTPYPAPLPVSPLQAQDYSAKQQQPQHFSIFVSLAAAIRDDEIRTADAAFRNFLFNVRDHDIGIFSSATLPIGRGASFSVRRTVIAEHNNVVFKSSLPNTTGIDENDEQRRLETILLELRVLTHPPIRTHENIVKLLQVGWESDAVDVGRKWPVLVMEYADRGTLADYFDHESGTPFETRKELCADVAKGLLALHRCAIVHGDLKMENVLIFSCEDGHMVTAKISDFGGALLDSDAIGSVPMATPPWNAPEWKIDRPRSRLVKSDIYSLGLLVWRIMINGKNQFDDPEIFSQCSSRREQYTALDTEKMIDALFLDKAIQSVLKWGIDVDQGLISHVFSASIRTDEDDRNLDTVADLLKSSVSTDVPQSLESRTDIMQHNELVKLLESMEITLEDKSVERRIEAATALAMMNLAGDDFGLIPDIDRGLHFLILAAQLGSRPCQALVLRFHEAFDRPVPDSVAPRITEWLSEAAASGSMTALEDLEKHGFHAEAKASQKLLQTKYCGIGQDLFEYDSETMEIMQSTNRDEVVTYLRAQLQEGKDPRCNSRGYILRIAASLGSTLALELLVNEFSAGVNAANEFQEVPLLFAARSGHLDALLILLRLGADPRLTNVTRDTPLHWLCSFHDSDVREAATALVRAGADINAQAKIYPDDEGLEYSETDYIAGTPLHRAIARNRPSAVRALLDLGADPQSPANDDTDSTPFALAVLLHYPDIVKLFLSNAGHDPSKLLLLPSGKSILTTAMSGGTLYGATMGRLIRHGPHLTSRAEETLAILLDAGAASHIHDLPGMSGCTAALFAAQSHVSVLNFLLRNGALTDINTPSERPPTDEEEDMRRPPLFEAISFGKLQNVSCLLQAGADAQVVMNPEKKVSILQHCAEMGCQDLHVIQQFIEQDVAVDARPPDRETPFGCAVVNRCFQLADFLLEKGANPNATYSNGLLKGSSYPSTVVGFLADENSQGSISCLDFLFRKRPYSTSLNFIVQPTRNYSIFHTFAYLPGDTQDPVVTSLALSLCSNYFNPSQEDLNLQSLPIETCCTSVVASGGNTALHLAAISANFEAVRWLLLSERGIDTSIRNRSGFTALDLAALSYPNFERHWTPNDIPLHPDKQLKNARMRRDAIWKLLETYTPEGVMEGLTEKYTLDDDDSASKTMSSGGESTTPRVEHPVDTPRSPSR